MAGGCKVSQRSLRSMHDPNSNLQPEEHWKQSEHTVTRNLIHLAKEGHQRISARDRK